MFCAIQFDVVQTRMWWIRIYKGLVKSLCGWKYENTKSKKYEKLKIQKVKKTKIQKDKKSKIQKDKKSKRQKVLIQASRELGSSIFKYLFQFCYTNIFEHSVVLVYSIYLNTHLYLCIRTLFVITVNIFQYQCQYCSISLSTFFNITVNIFQC